MEKSPILHSLQDSFKPELKAANCSTDALTDMRFRLDPQRHVHQKAHNDEERNKRCRLPGSLVGIAVEAQRGLNGLASRNQAARVRWGTAVVLDVVCAALVKVTTVVLDLRSVAVFVSYSMETASLPLGFINKKAVFKRLMIRQPKPCSYQPRLEFSYGKAATAEDLNRLTATKIILNIASQISHFEGY